jgi:chemotaxis protein methyltransferase CheR
METAAVVAPVAPPPQPRRREMTHSAEAVKKPEEARAPDLAQAVRALANQGKLDEALAASERAIAADKLNPALYYLDATILQEEDRDGEAMAALKRALYLDPRFVLAHFSLGNLAQRRGNAMAAKRSFENALALLGACGQDDILPEAEGLTAGRLREIIRATLQTGALT